MFSMVRLVVLPALLAIAPPAMAEEAATAETVLAASEAAFGASCYDLGSEIGAGFLPLRYEVTLSRDEDMVQTQAVVWQVFCNSGAYNFTHIYWIETDHEGLKPLSFPFPVFDVIREQPDNIDSALKELRLTGWVADHQLVNTDFDPATLTFSHFNKGRGIGDISQSGLWVLGVKGARIVSFDVDESYDGEMNPITLYGE